MNTKRITFEQFQKALDIVDKYKQQCKDDLVRISEINTKVYTKDTTLWNLDISVRLYNVLKKIVGSPDTTLYEISLISYDRLSHTYGFGKAMFNELNEVLINAGLNTINK